MVSASSKRLKKIHFHFPLSMHRNVWSFFATYIFLCGIFVFLPMKMASEKPATDYTHTSRLVEVAVIGIVAPEHMRLYTNQNCHILLKRTISNAVLCIFTNQTHF